MKIGNTSFNIEAIKGMSFDEFEKTYKGLLNGADLKETYKKITGKEGVNSRPVKSESFTFETSKKIEKK